MYAIQGRLARRTPARHAGRTALALALALAAGGAQASDAWQTSGDVRFGYVGSETRARSGATTDADSVRARVRFRVRGELGGGWHASGRVAARLDSEQDDAEFWLRSYAPGPQGLEDGQATIDEAYLEYRAAESPWSLRLGRFQAAFAIDDIMKKSLDQNDSTNFDITWTDGAWWQWRGQDWTTHVIARHNDRRGPTGALRRPLDFADGGARRPVRGGRIEDGRRPRGAAHGHADLAAIRAAHERPRRPGAGGLPGGDREGRRRMALGPGRHEVPARWRDRLGARHAAPRGGQFRHRRG
ncbi:porin [Luteimonas sp. MC1825]|nr:porin [Luteimonas sp. MC1825]QOC88162.1 porin [Luteimonas sp. MC1825]